MTKIQTDKYNFKETPKSLYGFEKKSTDLIVQNVKNGTLSDDAREVAIYILRYDRKLEENQINQIKFELQQNLENNILNDYRVKVIEKDDLIKIEYENNNRMMWSILIAILSISYLIFILPFSIQKLKEGDYIYLFGMLIIFIPFIIVKMIGELKKEKNFYLKVDNNFFIIKSISTNFNELTIEKSNIIGLRIIENNNHSLKLVAERKNKKNIEILSEFYSNLNKDEIIGFLTLIKNKINEKIK